MKNTWITSVGTLEVVTEPMVVVVSGMVVVVVVGGMVSRKAAGNSSSGTGENELESEMLQEAMSATPTTAVARRNRVRGA
jgi:hypothetical protein